MAACGSLRHIFDNPIVPENNTSSSSTSSLIDSLSHWNHIKTRPPLDHSFTEIFGELHFKENHPNTPPPSFFPPSSSSSAVPVSAAFPIDLLSKTDDTNKHDDGYSKSYHRKSNSFSSLNSDSLQLCTEGLGSESLGDVEDLTMEIQKTQSHNDMKEKVHVRRHSNDSYCRKIKINGKTMFPPPIPYIGQAGKPSVSFQSYRQDGRFVLKEVRIPTHECLQASREDGRLRLSIVQPDDEELEEEQEEDNDDDNNDNVVEDNGREEEDREEGEISSVGRIEDDDEEGEGGRGEGVKDEDEAEVGDYLVRSYS